MNPKLLSGANLAFLGDAYYELYIRRYVMNKGITQLQKLHDECVKYVSRTAQHKIANAIFDRLTDEEKEIFKRGRNYHYKVKTDEYINASGYEAVIGYLHLIDQSERLETLLSISIEIIEKG